MVLVRYDDSPLSDIYEAERAGKDQGRPGPVLAVSANAVFRPPMHQGLPEDTWAANSSWSHWQHQPRLDGLLRPPFSYTGIHFTARRNTP